LVGCAWAITGSADWPEALLAITLLAACLVASLFEFLGAVLRARGAYGLETRQALWSALAGNLLAGAAGYATQSELVAAIVMLAFRVTAISMQLGVVAKQLGITGSMVDSRHRREVFATLHGGLPFTLDGVAVQLVGYVDTLVAKLLMSEHSFGVYMAGSRLLQALLTGIPVLASVFVPNLVRASGDPMAMRRQQLALYGLCSAGGFVLGGAILIGAPWIGAWIFGRGFVELASLLPVFGLAIAVRYFAAAPALELTARGLQLRRMWVNLCCTLLFVFVAMLPQAEATSLRSFAWLFCGLGLAQLVLFGVARVLPGRAPT
jgi:O-antigen/teichoic acid export membrane protein